MKITAPVYRVLDEQVFESGFKKRVLVIKTMEEYSQLLPIEFTKDRVKLLDGLSEGDMITVNCSLKGNEYKDKFYLSLFGLTIDAEQDGNEVIVEAAREKATMQHDPDQDDDLPF